MNAKQQRLLNSVCGDLSAQVGFDGNGKYANVASGKSLLRLHKDDWRHALAGKAKDETFKLIPDWEDARRQITLGTSSLKLTVEEANMAIEMAYALGSRLGVRWTLDMDGNDGSSGQVAAAA